jgi:hypothetical protein
VTRRDLEKRRKMAANARAPNGDFREFFQRRQAVQGGGEKYSAFQK